MLTTLLLPLISAEYMYIVASAKSMRKERRSLRAILCSELSEGDKKLMEQKVTDRTCLSIFLCPIYLTIFYGERIYRANFNDGLVI